MVDWKINILGKEIHIKNLEILTIVSLITLYSLAYYLEPGMWLYERIASLSRTWTKMATQSDAALLMAFAFSIFGNTSILIVFPYALIVFLIGQHYSNWLLLGVVSGIGAGIGEITSYFIGRMIGSSKSMSESEMGEKFQRMRRKLEEKPKAIPFTIFFFAMTPLPDDVILVPFGIMKYPYYKSIIPCMLGKTVMCTILAWLGYIIGQNTDFLNAVIEYYPYLSFLRLIVPTEEVNPASDLIQFSLIIIVIYIMIRMDFESWEIKHSNDRKKLENLLREGGNVTTEELKIKLNIISESKFKESFMKLLELTDSVKKKNNLIHFDGISDRKKAFELSFEFFKVLLNSQDFTTNKN